MHVAEPNTPPVSTNIAFPWQRLLVPVDFSPPSEAAFVYALTLANITKAEVYVSHIIPVPHVLDVFYERGLTPPESVKHITRKARRRVKEIIQATGASLPVRIRFHEGEAAVSILEQAAKLKVDLIVMGTHGRRGASRFFLGSVAETVIRRAPCPVLTLRA